MTGLDRRRLLGLFSGAGAALALGACGISPGDEVVRDGPGPTAGPGVAPAALATPPKRTPTEVPSVLVTEFLQASAGDHGTQASHAQVMEVLKSYLSPAAIEEWSPGTEVNLVRLTTQPTRTDVKGVYFSVQHLGVLTPDGRIEPPRLTQKTYTIEVEKSATGPGLVITKPPNDLLLIDTAVAKYYDVRPIYFLSSGDASTLVPDLRYLPRAVPPEQQGNRLLEWLVNGPSSWLDRAVARLPEGTARRGNITLSADNVTVNLTASVSDATALDNLAAQLWWTLRPDRSNRGLQLRTEGVPVTTSTAYLSKNAAVLEGTLADEPRRYAVVDGSLHRLRSGPATAPLALGNVNQNVVVAAVSRRAEAVALVRKRYGHHQLWIGAVDRILYSGLDGESMSAPTWLDRGKSKLLVIVNGEIYAVDVEGGHAPVHAERLPGKVTAMSVAPDGRRMALVIGGKLYVATLIRDSNRVTSFSIGQPRLVPTGLSDLKGVAFTKEDHLVIAGLSPDQEVLLFEITVDGVLRSDKLSPARLHTEISNLVAYVDNPITGPGLNLLLDMDGSAYQVFGNTIRDPEPLSQFLVSSPTPTPSASASALSPTASPSPPTPPTVSAACFEG
ncbi:LpqB family beta-propeller domain-containing protein [Catellatospora tritici]|uniref:LpqB family beta-propeller domain-containing protein n=1 Tax=Catellatospora tritici TaxID=2851566 RepID=UPI001C2D5635|nr:LpqB family beta-propeller domain-containing protein [Catellatospora tritici]MBV1849474.1 GerMN domain-containing protein [Catellatospora tritici]MBV1854046.1 GerMN domain-containing protein [Catellatospora tritici]